MGKIISTSDRPTGKLHLNHYIGSLCRRAGSQNAGNHDRMFDFMADEQVPDDNADKPEKIRQNLIETGLDNLSVSLNPQRCTIFVLSRFPKIFNILKKAFDKVRETVAQTLNEVLHAICIDYFEDAVLIEEQASSIRTNRKLP